MSEEISDIINIINDDMHKYEVLHDKIISYLTREPRLKKMVHSYKSRFKDPEHLRKKIIRKNDEDLSRDVIDRKGPITTDNVKNRITDICGIRILHLYVGQFPEIHNTLMEYVSSGELFLYERPKAYTWDPEYAEFFKQLDLNTELKESFYTSVHYVFKARADNDVTCEVQVRTLFEEVWGEIDHIYNYPNKSDNKVMQEQLKVLARIVGAGTRLADSIFSLSQK